MSKTAVGVGAGDLDLLEILLRGPDAWNQWRKENPKIPIDLNNANLSNVNLHDADLSDANLHGVNLSLADLGSAILCNVDFRNADLRNTNLSYANLDSTDLSGANLSGANLSDANLSFANFTLANLSGANLREAILNRANLRGAIISDSTLISPKWKLIHRIITQSIVDEDLRSKDLTFANLSTTDLISADLSSANLSIADLNSANLSDANLRKTNLNGANLSYANLNGANLNGANLRDAILEGTNLGDTDLTDTNLINADLKEANLNGAIISVGTQIDPKWLSGLNQGNPLSWKTHQNFDIKVFDPDINNSEKAKLQAAIDKFAEASGYEEINVLSERLGSWFKKIRYRIAKLISQDIQEEAIQAGQEFYRSGKSYALNKLEKTGVESTKQIAEATAEILKAVENLDDVVLLLGKLIVMKYTNDDGRSKTYVKTISSDLQLKLESTPELLDSPQAIIDFLKSQEELPPAIEEQKALPATPEPLK